jgi:hypothetical protein
MNETPASDSSNPDIVTQLANSDDPIRLSVAVSSSGVPSSADGESVQDAQAEYERLKAALDEQQKRFFREMAKLKVQLLLLELRGSREVARYFNSKSTPSDSWLPVNFLDQQPPLLRRK